VRQLTNSSLSVFRDCPRKYLYSYMMGRRRLAAAAPLEFGRAWHRLMEPWWMGTGDVKAAMVEAAKTVAVDQAPKLAAMMACYRAVLPNGTQARDEFKVLAVEQTFENFRITNPDTGRPMADYALAGKVDGLLEDRDGGKWVLEHKTTSDDIVGFGPYWQRLSIDLQIAYYMLATGAKGVLYDVARKPAIKLCGKDEKEAAKMGISPADAYQQRCIEAIQADPDAYFQLRPVVKTADDLVEAQSDLWNHAHMLSECEKINRWPRNSNACRGFFGTCEFLDVCTGQARIDDDTLYRTKHDTHEELTDTPDAG